MSRYRVRRGFSSATTVFKSENIKEARAVEAALARVNRDSGETFWVEKWVGGAVLGMWVTLLSEY